jgi:hypothetical protein
MATPDAPARPLAVVGWIVTVWLLLVTVSVPVVELTT